MGVPTAAAGCLLSTTKTKILKLKAKAKRNIDIYMCCIYKTYSCTKQTKAPAVCCIWAVGFAVGG
jgi:hypothetical protein